MTPTLICIRPRCDCVRLKGESAFIFLPLDKPEYKTEQIIVKLGNEFRRMRVKFKIDGWVHRKFMPSKHLGEVVAIKETSNVADDAFSFTDKCGKRYTWRGELKTEYMHRIVQKLSEELSRVAVDESEWLRRMVRTKQPKN